MYYYISMKYNLLSGNLFWIHNIFRNIFVTYSTSLDTNYIENMPMTFEVPGEVALCPQLKGLRKTHI